MSNWKTLVITKPERGISERDLQVTRVAFQVKLNSAGFSLHPRIKAIRADFICIIWTKLKLTMYRPFPLTQSSLWFFPRGWLSHYGWEICFLRFLPSFLISLDFILGVVNFCLGRILKVYNSFWFYRSFVAN